MSNSNVLTRSKKKQAEALLRSNRLPEAKALYEKVCFADRRDANAWEALGGINQGLGNLDEAARCYREAIRIEPRSFAAHFNLGAMLANREKFTDAVESYRIALRLNPEHAELHYNLGNALMRLGKFKESAQSYRKAITLKPSFLLAHHGLGLALISLDQVDEAIVSFRRAIEIKPDFADAHNNLGTLLLHRGQLGDSVRSFNKAIEFNANYAVAHNNLGTALLQQGRIEDAIASYQAACRLKPDDAAVHDNLLFALNYHPAGDPAAIFAEHTKWGRRYGHLSAGTLLFANLPDAGKRLRIGYLSPDFHTHSVAYYFEPILAHHSHLDTETFCYSDVAKADPTTSRLRELASHWRDINGKTDEETVAIIRTDEIDILVDLAGHTRRNRLAVFAFKPAPVQVTYLGYPNTTGLVAMDYRLTDIVADPPGQEMFHTEKLVRLPYGFLCYKPSAAAPPVGPPPARAKGHITLGSFNNLSKMNSSVLAVWTEILTRLPGTRLILKNKSLSDQPTCARLIDFFAKKGIASGRVEMVGWLHPGEHLALYGQVDIALDTFPYNGTTTTCEALWMGVPVVALAGNRHAGLVGASLLTQIGLPDLLAQTTDDYVNLVVQLAGDSDKLAALRATLRERMTNSPLCDARTFVAQLEEVYRRLWREWCATADRKPAG